MSRIVSKGQRTFHLKDDNGKLWVEAMIVTLFLDAVITADILTSSNNNVKICETRTVHFA